MKETQIYILTLQGIRNCYLCEPMGLKRISNTAAIFIVILIIVIMKIIILFIYPKSSLLKLLSFRIVLYKDCLYRVLLKASSTIKG